jgi:hypothetical protein
VTKEVDTLVTLNNHGALDEGDEEKFGASDHKAKFNSDDKLSAFINNDNDGSATGVASQGGTALAACGAAGEGQKWLRHCRTSFAWIRQFSASPSTTTISCASSSTTVTRGLACPMTRGMLNGDGPSNNHSKFAHTDCQCERSIDYGRGGAGVNQADERGVNGQEIQQENELKPLADSNSSGSAASRVSQGGTASAPLGAAGADGNCTFLAEAKVKKDKVKFLEEDLETSLKVKKINLDQQASVAGEESMLAMGKK